MFKFNKDDLGLYITMTSVGALLGYFVGVVVEKRVLEEEEFFEPVITSGEISDVVDIYTMPEIENDLTVEAALKEVAKLEEPSWTKRLSPVQLEGYRAGLISEEKAIEFAKSAGWRRPVDYLEPQKAKKPNLDDIVVEGSLVLYKGDKPPGIDVRRLYTWDPDLEVYYQIHNNRPVVVSETIVEDSIGGPKNLAVIYNTVEETGSVVYAQIGDGPLYEFGMSTQNAANQHRLVARDDGPNDEEE